MQYRSWTTLWIDRRKFPTCMVTIALIMAFIAWGFVSVAVSQSLPAHPGDPINTADLIEVQWWAIAGLLGIVGVLVGFIFLYLWNSTKADVRALWSQKLSKEEHQHTDHSVLCPRCRSDLR